LLNIIVGCM